MAESKIVFVGRLEKDTGILEFLKWLDKNSKYTVDFIGDGVFREKCEKLEMYTDLQTLPPL